MNNSSFCNSGKKQSPINIVSADVIECNSKCQLRFSYLQSNIHLFLSENNVVMKYDGNSSVKFKERTYYLEKISFTNPSSHNIDGERFPIEMNLYHRHENKTVVVSVFIQQNDSRTDSKYTFDQLVKPLRRLKPNRRVSESNRNFNIFNALPMNKTFFVYQGGLLNYPCTENVIWIVLKTPVNCSRAFYTSLVKFSKNNAKRIQNLNERKVYINIDKTKNRVNNQFDNYQSNPSLLRNGSRARSAPRRSSRRTYGTDDYTDRYGSIFHGDNSVYPFYYNYFGFDTLMYKMMALSGFYGEKPYRYISFIVFATLVIIFVLFVVFLVLSYNGTFNPLFDKIRDMSAKTQTFLKLLKATAASTSKTATNAAANVGSKAATVASNIGSAAASTAKNTANAAASAVSNVTNQ